MLTRAFFPREELNVYRLRGIEFIADHARGDANGAREILSSPMYLRFLPKLDLNGPANVLDLGASNGGFPLLLAANGIKLKKVVSLELNPDTFIRLRFNLERNLNCEITVANAAVCGETRMLDVPIGAGSVSDNIYGENTDSRAVVKTIPGLSYDEIVKTNFGGEIIDICKMDVEGAEFEILRSANHKKLLQCRYLLMEIHERDNRKASEILPIVAEMGFILEPQDPGSDTSVYFFVNSALSGQTGL